MKKQSNVKPESINAIICTVQNDRPAKIPVKITLGDHRLRFHSADFHAVNLETVGPVSLKPFLCYLYDLEPQPCEIVNIAAFLRFSVSRQQSRLSFVLRYSVKIQTGKGRYTIQEKEKVFITDADRETVIRYGDRYIQKLRDVNTEKTAGQLIQWYNEWAHPLTLEEVAASLTEEQKAKAAKLIREMFAA